MKAKLREKVEEKVLKINTISDDEETYQRKKEDSAKRAREAKEAEKNGVEEESDEPVDKCCPN